jgi:Mce-associated membrane protein
MINVAAAVKFARAVRRRWVTVTLSAGAVLAMSVVTVLVIGVYRPAQQVDKAASAPAVAAARDGAITILSYAPDTVGQDLETAKSYLTGDFLSYYSEFTGQFVEPAALQKGVHNSATVVRWALAEMHPARAKVLLFINQSTTTKEKPQPTVTASSVLVTVAKTDGRWLISSFDPNPV